VNSINKDNLKLIGKSEENLNILDLEKLNLNDLKTRLTIENGFVNVKPFTVNYKDIAIEVAGSHGFDK